MGHACILEEVKLEAKWMTGSLVTWCEIRSTATLQTINRSIDISVLK